MNFIAITNNTAFLEKYENEFDINYYDTDLRSILVIVRDMVHEGHIILTHPLSGSVKPKETPLKTVFLTKKKGALDADSLTLIENAIITCDKFIDRKISYERALEDFQLIDLSLAESALPGLMAF